MITLACILAALLATCIWWSGRLYERVHEKQDNYTYIGSFGEHWENEDDDYWDAYLDEPEFK